MIPQLTNPQVEEKPELKPVESAPARRGTAGIYGVGFVLVASAFAGVFVLASGRKTAEAAEARERKAEVAAGPILKVVPVEVNASGRTVTLPGEVKAFQQVTLYAKVSGYLKDIKVDKGDRVKRDQLLATLESPDADQQVAGAQADLENKKAQARRSADLSKKGIVSAQQAENDEAAVKVAGAALERARALKAYEEIRAPFAGVVTARFADPGALLPAATGSTQSAQPVLEVSDMDKLRVYVYLGQEDAARVRDGDAVQIAVDGSSGAPIAAKVTRITRALDPRTRTMLSEIDLDNREGQLYPGQFVHVQLQLTGGSHPRVPTQALISRGDKLSVAVVRDGKAHLVPITVGHDDGSTVEVLSGLSGGEQVAVNAAGLVSEGAPVRIAGAR